MNSSDSFDVLSIDINDERLIYLSQTIITCTWKRYFADMFISNPSNKVWKIVRASKRLV